MYTSIDGAGVPYNSDRQYITGKVRSSTGVFPFIGFLCFTAATIWILNLFSPFPLFSIVMADLLACVYLTFLFRDRPRSYLFLLHPFLILISSQLFPGSSYLEGGDGPGYASIAYGIIEMGPLSYIDNLYSQYPNIFSVVRAAYLGVVPSYFIPEYFFGSPDAAVYYISQASFHVYLCGLVATLALSWRSIDPEIVFIMTLFAVVSPTFFEIGGVPTRHYVTFFGLYLLIMSHIALLQRLSIGRFISWLVAMLVVFISKAPYFLPYFLFILLQVFVSANQGSMIRRFTFAMIGAAVFLTVLLPYFLNIISGMYAPFIGKGMSVIPSTVMGIPVIGWIIKYIYALLAPFPWTEAPYFVETIYSGNVFLFFMHVLSSLTGVYLFTALLAKWKLIWRDRSVLKQIVLYGVVMSSSILAGATGFHVYLSIFFPFLAPLLLYRRLRVSPVYPVAFVIVAEVLTDLLR